MPTLILEGLESGCSSPAGIHAWHWFPVWVYSLMCPICRFIVNSSHLAAPAQHTHYVFLELRVSLLKNNIKLPIWYDLYTYLPKHQHTLCPSQNTYNNHVPSLTIVIAATNRVPSATLGKRTEEAQAEKDKWKVVFWPSNNTPALADGSLCPL